ncbi:Bug family tripartite tricarboxylate transporter substrate binding protein [Polynucleobacter kasalickyi]|uniref:Tripartite-type tricarboxylate transporter, receptor component TctC n=1 Tax=Polynucleobacter kasalickyi TaxID=1938817 RepID=A0A1W1Y3C6_9BURK|nr:tripartite tricarboxylate transporter substrate binding protein [Polynucleobacter kasalickyi]SMC30662.1 Tripartite-type tricarboxylate transporter, receptor component TctC [Polynucleobacter kasalickyi]
MISMLQKHHQTKFSRGLLSFSLLALFTTSPSIVYSQTDTYPNRAITMTLPMAAGGTSDLVARMLAPALNEEFGQTVIIENRPGANGAIGEEFFSRAKPDGYNIMLESTSIATNPWMSKQTYDARKDFIPVILMASVPLVLVVNEKVPAKNLAEFIELAKKQPGKISYSSWGNGSIGHFAGESFKISAKVDILHVPYKSTAQSISDALAGQVNSVFPTLPLAIQHLKSGKIRALAVLSAKRSPMAPEIPTTAELGYPGLEIETWFGFFLPAKTPDAIVQKVYQVASKVIQRPEIKAKLEEQGFRMINSPPAEFAKYYQAEIARYGKIVKEANLKDAD